VISIGYQHSLRCRLSLVGWWEPSTDVFWRSCPRSRLQLSLHKCWNVWRWSLPTCRTSD